MVSGQAIFVTSHGGPEVLALRDHDPGAPGPSQARIRVEAAGVNFIDTYQRTGAYPRKPPFVLGVEGAGVIEAIGNDVQDFKVGARVAWTAAAGSYATTVLAEAAVLVPVPDAVPSDVAAAAMMQGMTAHYLSHSVRQPKTGDVALVHAAAGGTGRLLVQWLARAGVRVIGTCSTDEKARAARAAGAAEVIRYDEVDFAIEAKRLTAGVGVDVVYDSVGRTTFDGSLASLRVRGLLVLFGQASGAVPAFDLQRLNQGGSLFVTRPSLGHYVATRAELLQHATAVLSAIGARELELVIDRKLPLSAAADAHRLLESRATSGKVLLIP